ncbi:hypothetical protein JBE04_15450 [Streptomyces sp. PRKS01-29]|nr:hypothetical protein [Streptomyces sabulosicollis]MBI0295825.1 hypothetical protein [Streptomyces sabulosicollis]
MQKKQMMVLGVCVAGVLWINHNGDGNTRDDKSPNPRQTARYPVHFDKKDDGKDTKKRPEPRSTVSYPIKFHHR